MGSVGLTCGAHMDMKAATVYAAPLLKTLNETVPSNRTDVLLQSPLLVAAMAAQARGMSLEEFTVAAQGIYLEVMRQTQN